MTKRAAVIEIGTNGIRLEVAEVRGTHRVKTIEKRRARIRLGSSVFTAGLIAPHAFLDAVDAVERFATSAGRIRGTTLRVFGTAALRDAANRDSFVRRVQARSGVHVEILSAMEEARLATVGVLAHRDSFGREDCLHFDLGGGSTELSLLEGGRTTHFSSLPLGAVRIAGQFPLQEQGALPSMHNEVRRILAANIDPTMRVRLAHSLIVGGGGTLRALQRLVQGDGPAPLVPCLTTESLKATVASLHGMDLRDRKRALGRDEHRADIIVAGASIAALLLEHLLADDLIVSRWGARHGALAEMVRERPASQTARYKRRTA